MNRRRAAALSKCGGVKSETRHRALNPARGPPNYKRGARDAFRIHAGRVAIGNFAAQLQREH